MSWLVGIEAEGALKLRRAFDDAALSLDASASRVQRLLDEAGTSSRAPMDIRGAARTCAGTAQDLSRRLSVIQSGPTDGHPNIGVSLPGPGLELGPIVFGCGVVPAPTVVMSCNPPPRRPLLPGASAPVGGIGLRGPADELALGSARLPASPTFSASRESEGDDDGGEAGREVPVPELAPRPPVTDQPRDGGGNVIGGTGPGKGETLSGAEAQSVRDYEAGRNVDQGMLASARRKITGQEKYKRMRNRQKRQ